MKKTTEKILRDIFSVESKLHKIQDFDILLELILTEARLTVNADAGSIYVVDGEYLAIKYAQNDTLKKKLKPGEKLPFVSFSFPINDNTIAGYVANNDTIVNEANVYNISAEKKYKFGVSSDIKTGYKTVSSLTLPLVSPKEKVLGVLQVLNAKDKHGNIKTFSKHDEMYLKHFATNAAEALEHAALTRSIIMRMVRMSELRDPSETGVHIKRVSSYAVEIYDRWAFNKKISDDEQIKFRDDLKIAALLHDVGKVAIPDKILKKPGRLETDEYENMKTHTWLGAQLFSPHENDFDKFVSETILRHHERWDGLGYPGKINIKDGTPLVMASDTGKPEGLRGEEIPLAARIIALADVYDALSCRRCYKEPWSEDDIIAELKQCRGKNFDPEILDAFFEIYPRIVKIRESYNEDLQDSAMKLENETSEEK